MAKKSDSQKANKHQFNDEEKNELSEKIFNSDSSLTNGINMGENISLNSPNEKQDQLNNLFVFEFDNSNDTLTIKKDGKVVAGPWIVCGKDGERGKSAYEEWAVENPGSFNDFINSLKGEKGSNGKNGASAFELWLQQQAPEHRGNIQDFFNWLKGEHGDNGKNGATAYEIWLTQGNKGSEKDFIDSLKGEAGKSGDNGKSTYDAWLSLGNHGSKEDFLKSLKGSDGLAGKNGMVGKDGDSAYQTWLKEGYKGDEGDFLKWIQEARKGEKGDNGRQGKSAYEIWLEEGNQGTKAEFLGSLRGRDGQMPPYPEYGYKNVKDFQCPEIKINPNLIILTEKVIDNRIPENIIEETIDEIKELRAQGREKENYGDWFKESMWWCAGADKALLRMCPSDHTKNAGIGTIILFTGLMAALSGFIAFSCVFDVLWACIFFAIFWGSLIFFLDRFITNTMGVGKKVSIYIYGLPRIIISIFLAIVISAPLELIIFDKEIQTKINNEIRVENSKKAKSIFSEKLELNNAIKERDSIKLELKTMERGY